MSTKYINPQYIKHQNENLAIEFDSYLQSRIPWSPDDFGGDYAWNDVIPDRDKWGPMVDELIKHLNEVHS